MGYIKLPYEIGSIFTIESYVKNDGNRITTYYFDLLSDLTFAVFRDENPMMRSSNPQKCIRLLRDYECDVKQEQNFTYLIS